MVAWITDYLFNRLQHVRIKLTVSDVVTESTGAPQGTMLWPLLFTIYTSHFTTHSECHLQKFSETPQWCQTVQQCHCYFFILVTDIFIVACCCCLAFLSLYCLCLLHLWDEKIVPLEGSTEFILFKFNFIKKWQMENWFTVLVLLKDQQLEIFSFSDTTKLSKQWWTIPHDPLRFNKSFVNLGPLHNTGK